MNSRSCFNPQHLVEAAARTAFTYLSATDPMPDEPADAVIGFGTFDLALARFCGELHARARAGRIVFTGGYGAGTADLGMAEADAWSAELLRVQPGFRRDRLIRERQSTNTAENVRFTSELLERRFPQFALGRGIRTALIVAAPARMRRVRLTLQKLLPSLHVVRCLPPVDFERERALYGSKRLPFLALLTGELDRIVSYPARGWITAEPLPAKIAAAHAVLRCQP